MKKNFRIKNFVMKKYMAIYIWKIFENIHLPFLNPTLLIFIYFIFWQNLTLLILFLQYNEHLIKNGMFKNLCKDRKEKQKNGCVNDDNLSL